MQRDPRRFYECTGCSKGSLMHQSPLWHHKAWISSQMGLSTFLLKSNTNKRGRGWIFQIYRQTRVHLHTNESYKLPKIGRLSKKRRINFYFCIWLKILRHGLPNKVFKSRFTSHDANQMKGLHSGLFLHMESHWMWSNPQWDIRTFSPGWNNLLFFLGSTSGADFRTDIVLQNPVCALDLFYIRIFPNFDAGCIKGKKEGCVPGHPETDHSFLSLKWFSQTHWGTHHSIFLCYCQWNIADDLKEHFTMLLWNYGEAKGIHFVKNEMKGLSLCFVEGFFSIHARRR